jgi:hypothetical protein
MLILDSSIPMLRSLGTPCMDCGRGAEIFLSAIDDRTIKYWQAWGSCAKYGRDVDSGLRRSVWANDTLV